MKKLYSLLFLLLVISETYSQNYTVLGSASSVGGCNCYRLTPDANDQAGAIFQNQTINLNNSFDFTFNAFLGCNNGNDAADGIVFVLTSNPQGLGSGGGGLGYAGGNQPFSFAVEFDTWENSGDPSYDHIGIESGGSVGHNVAGAVPALPGSGNIDNCQWYLVRMVWDVNTNTYSVYFNGVLRISINIPNVVNSYFGGNPIVNWGWTAGTGGGTNDQQICVLNTSSWVSGINYQSCDLNMQFSDISTSSLGSVQSWAWTFGDGGTSTLQNPTHTYAALGTYTVTLVITDISGCTNTYTHPVTFNPPIALSPTITSPPCNGGANGGISIISSGGFGPAAGYGGYMYRWNNNTTQSNLVGAGAGTYTLTVTDGVCTTTAQYTVNQPTPLTATTSHTDATCGNDNGTASITITGGTTPYTGTPPNPINWGIGHNATLSGSTWTASGLSGNTTFVADFQDANGCSALTQYRETIASLPCGISTNLVTSNVTCWGSSNGTATLTVTGGSGGSVPGWSQPIAGTFTISGLAAGPYNYSYSDGSNPLLNFSGTFTISQPGAAMVAFITTNNMSCSNTNDGQALASVTSGGVTPYIYNWSRGTIFGAVSSGLSPGPVSVTVTDASGCTATATGLVTGPPVLTLNVTKVDDPCYLSRTGSATANMSGGNPPYTYYWSNISSAQTNLSLGQGTYTVTVTDSKGCSITGSATLTQAAPFTHTLTSQNISTCFGDANGSIIVTPTGGVLPLTYSWNPGTLSGNNPTGLIAGQYNLTLSDANNCQILDSVVITQPTALVVTTSHTDATCFGANDGTLTVNIAGGTPPYNYGGIPVPPGTTTIPNLPDSTYSGTVADASGCSVAVSETIAEPAQLILTETHTNVSCFGGNDGSIDITVTGGVTPYTYLWNDGVTTEDRNNMTAGIYTLRCPATGSCSASITINITEPLALSLSETHVNVACNGGNTGSIDITAADGTPPYTYNWGGGITTEDRTNITAGTYTPTCTDANLCTASITIIVTEPTALTVTTSHTDVTCYEANNGTLTVNVNGGTAPYNFGGFPVPAGTTVLPGLPDSTYAGNIADANGCFLAVTETIIQPGPQSLQVLSVTDNICNGGTIGAVSLNFVNATGAAAYDWNPGGIQPASRTGLTAALYNITATDQNLCTVSTSATVNEPPAPLMTVTAVDAVCFGGNGSATANPVGGGPFTYIWSAGGTTQTITPPAGSYTVSAADANSCNQTAAFIINQPSDITIAEVHTDLRCFGDADGTITLTPSGGAGAPYSYNWSPNVSTTNIATSLVAGSYTIIVSDASNCPKPITITLSQPSLPVTLVVITTNVTCYGYTDGSINATPSGGVPGYSFAASDGTNPYSSSSGLFSLLPAGTYTITVTDQNVCTASTTAVVNGPGEISPVIDTFQARCYNTPTGRILVSVLSGGVSPFSFSLSNGDMNITGIFNNVLAGTYQISITDANNCRLDTNATVTEPDTVLLSVAPTPVEVKMGESLQLVTTVNQSGGLTYNWTPSIGLSCSDCANPVFDGIYSQRYEVLVTTEGGCTGTAEFVVTVIPDYGVFIPNAFTPDGTGVNDTWKVYTATNSIKQIQVMVFNRWGEKVFESTDINFGWDGTYKGQKVPPAVYVYTAKFVWMNNHSDSHYHGTVTVLH